jgi:hypothetical protein
MDLFVPWCMSHFFADDLIAVISGQIGVRFTDQCLDLEKRINFLLEYLVFYSLLLAQPINMSKTEAMFSARAIGSSKFDIFLKYEKEENIKWVKEFKYLGHWISPKLGWSKMIEKMMTKVR